MFPAIYDTKVLSKQLQNRMKHIRLDLSSLFKACLEAKTLKPFCNISEKILAEFLVKQNKHQAGYDAFITGCAFLGMSNSIAQK